MFELLIDTNIYRKDPVQSGLPFKALARLCKAKAARLHIPYIVLREFQTQQVDIYQKEMQATIRGVTNVVGKRLSTEVKSKLEEVKGAVEAVMPAVISDAANGIVKWAEEVHAVLHPLGPEDAKLAMEAYFNGQLPLKEPKVRKDIPDSFLFQSALTILRSTTTLYVISEDGAFSEAAATVNGIRVLKSLNDFIELHEVQAALQKQDEAEKIALVIKELMEFTDGSSFPVLHSLGEKVLWKKIRSRSIPDDNHEATIRMFGDPENIKLEFTEAAYYGDGQLGLPFSCTMNVSAFYYMYKSDFYALNEDAMPSVSDHNDHYFEAESEFEILIHGALSFYVKLDEFAGDKNLEEYVDFDAAEIDEIDRLELVES